MAENGSPRLVSVPDGQLEPSTGPHSTRPPVQRPADTGAVARLPSGRGEEVGSRQSANENDAEEVDSDDCSESSVEEAASGPRSRTSRRTSESSSGRLRPTRRHQRQQGWFETTPGSRHGTEDIHGYTEHPSSFGVGGAPYSLPYAQFSPPVRRESHPSTTYYQGPPPPPPPHLGQHHPGTGAYGGYSAQAAAPGYVPFPVDQFSGNQPPYPASYPTFHQPGIYGPGYTPPGPPRYHGSVHEEPFVAPQVSTSQHETRKAAKNGNTHRAGQPVTPSRQTDVREQAKQSPQQAFGGNEEHSIEDTHRRDIERLVRHQVKAEVRRRMQRRRGSNDAPLDLDGKRRNSESKRVGGKPVLDRQPDDNESLSSWGSRREVGSEQLSQEIKELIKTKVGESDGRLTSEPPAEVLSEAQGSRLELATLGSRELVSRAAIHDIVMEALRNLKIEEARGKQRADRGYVPSHDGGEGHFTVPPSVPQPPDSSRPDPATDHRQSPKDRRSTRPGARDAENYGTSYRASLSHEDMHVPRESFRDPIHTAQYQQHAPQPRRNSPGRPFSPELEPPSDDGRSSTEPEDPHLFPANPPPRVPNPPVQASDEDDIEAHAPYGDTRSGRRRRGSSTARLHGQGWPRDGSPDASSQARRREHRSHRRSRPEESSDDDQDFFFPPSPPELLAPRVYGQYSEAFDTSIAGFILRLRCNRELYYKYSKKY
ncbi:hypothetical protein GQ53DRAFT_758413 [Thozetella sp. PMI_491]|nr:hypothetical protein GQ53DRAFT_758413 [Thozetella sp. PMI_491]